MDITYGKGADAIYMTFRSGKFAKNRKIDGNTLIDLDSKGDMLGIGFLEAGKRSPIESPPRQ